MYLPYLSPPYREELHRKTAKQDIPSFDEWVQDQEFPSEKDPTRKVKFKALSPDRQKQVRSEYNQKRQKAEQEDKPKKKRPEGVSDKAKLKGIRVNKNTKIGDNAKISNSRVYDAEVNNATIENATITGGTWDKGQKVNGGSWSKDYDQSTIDFLDENFKGIGDAPVRLMTDFIEAGYDPKSGFLKSPKKVTNGIKIFVDNNKKWLERGDPTEKKVLETMKGLKKDTFNNLVSIANNLAKKKSEPRQEGFDRARAKRQKGFGKKAVREEIQVGSLVMVSGEARDLFLVEDIRTYEHSGKKGYYVYNLTEDYLGGWEDERKITLIPRRKALKILQNKKEETRETLKTLSKAMKAVFKTD